MIEIVKHDSGESSIYVYPTESRARWEPTESVYVKITLAVAHRKLYFQSK